MKSTVLLTCLQHKLLPVEPTNPLPDSLTGGRSFRCHHLCQQVHRERRQRHALQSGQCHQIPPQPQHCTQRHQTRKPAGEFTRGGDGLHVSILTCFCDSPPLPSHPLHISNLLHSMAIFHPLLIHTEHSADMGQHQSVLFYDRHTLYQNLQDRFLYLSYSQTVFKNSAKVDIFLCMSV